MRFLKDIIAKRSSVSEGDPYALEEWDELDELDDQDDQFWADADGDEAIDDDPMFPDEPLLTDEDAPVSNRPLQTDAPQSSLPQDSAAETDQEEIALKIWEMFDDDDDENDVEQDEPTGQEPDGNEADLAREALKSMIGPAPVYEKPPAPKPVAPTAPQGDDAALPVKRAGRVKTRMLGFHNPEHAVPQVFDRAETRDKSADGRFPVGWLVLIEGPGRGTSFPLHCGVSSVGRGADQKIRLDFGDNSISRDSHAVIAYDEDTNAFYVGHTGKANLVRLNGRPVLATEEISNFDLIRIGESTLRFVGFCGPEFAWDMTEDEEIVHAQAS